MNIGSPENLSIGEMARLALIATDSTHLKTVYDETKDDGQFRKDVDISVLKNNFPNFEFTKFMDGVREVYNLLKNE